MATFGSITRGPRARKRIQLPLSGAVVNEETGAWEGETIELDVTGLGPLDVADVASRARVFAQAKGVEEPDDGNEIYDWAKKLHTILLGCIDKDSPADAPKAFFDGGLEQIGDSKILSPEHVAYLYEQQQIWQEECAPGLKNMSNAAFLAAVVKTAGGDMSFFVNARPGTRWSFMRTLAALHLTSLTQKSDSSSSSAESTQN